MARNLIRADKRTLVYDLNPEAIQKTLAARDSGKAATSPTDLKEVDIVFTSLPSRASGRGNACRQRPTRGNEAGGDLH